eukprot:Colp12_sorted_trinity150504_noHs@26491
METRPSLLDMFGTLGRPVRVCAPMVRYSKLPFRLLVQKYGVDLAYSPMIVSQSFVRSEKARNSDFSTNSKDRPLVVQFAASNAEDFAAAAEIITPYADAVDLNCGCPQRWAMGEGYGAHLIKHPELIADMVKQAKMKTTIPVTIKIRVHNDIRQTVELARRAEAVGVSWIAVHGRTAEQRTQPVNLEAIAAVKAAVRVPVVANGDVCSREDEERTVRETGVDGVMSARGLLENPALFAGYSVTPWECVSDWCDIALATGTAFGTFHHHLMYMLEKRLSKPERLEFNSLTSTAAVLDWLDALNLPTLIQSESKSSPQTVSVQC